MDYNQVRDFINDANIPAQGRYVSNSQIKNRLREIIV